jgi:lysophospholipase-2
MKSVDLLKKLGMKTVAPGDGFARPGLRVESYPGMGHSSCNEELAHLLQWIDAALK